MIAMSDFHWKWQWRILFSLGDEAMNSFEDECDSFSFFNCNDDEHDASFDRKYWDNLRKKDDMSCHRHEEMHQVLVSLVVTLGGKVDYNNESSEYWHFY